MNKVVRYSLIAVFTLIVGLLVVYVVLINSFNIFTNPEKEVLNSHCNDEGLREVITYKYNGNATTNQTINVVVGLGCSNNSDTTEMKTIFSVKSDLETTLVTKWKSLDTLKVLYSHKLKPIIKMDSVTYKDSNLNLIIEYEKEY